MSLPYLDRTLFGQIAAFVPLVEEDDTVQEAWSSLAGESGFYSEVRGGPPNHEILETRRNGILHSWNDQPAAIIMGTRQWFRFGRLHRDQDLPAIITHDGTQIWYQHGRRHRDGDKPAYVDVKGTRVWFQYGKIHREGDDEPPAKIDNNGLQFWYYQGQTRTPPPCPQIMLLLELTSLFSNPDSSSSDYDYWT